MTDDKKYHAILPPINWSEQ